MSSFGERDPLLHEREKFAGLASTERDVNGKKGNLITAAIGLPFRAYIHRHNEA